MSLTSKKYFFYIPLDPKLVYVALCVFSYATTSPSFFFFNMSLVIHSGLFHKTLDGNVSICIMHCVESGSNTSSVCQTNCK